MMPASLRKRAPATAVSLTAPVGGWNARDALGSMEPLDAVYLQNWFPATSDVVLRNGFINFATGFPAQVQTVMDYAGNASSKLFGISGGNIYDATTGGAIGAAAVTGLTNSKWQYINVATAAGEYLMLVNGVDKAQYFDGTAWHKDGDGSPYTITGADSSQCIGINLFKNRVWLCQDQTLNAWYGGTSDLGGAYTLFPLQGIAFQGGYLIGMATWTIDAGYGVDDLCVFITSKGQYIVYNGTDPSTADTWALVGVFNLGSPVGHRCFIKYAGDMLILCQDGLVPLAGALQSSRVNPKVALSNKIEGAMSQATSIYGNNFGWDLLYYPKNNMVIVNVPVADGSQQQQFVMNTITKSWCNFTGWNANCWVLHGDEPYFGGNQVIGKAWSGLDDNGASINGDGKQAFNYFKAPGLLKRWMMMRPIISTNGVPAIQANINVDFDDTPPSTPIAFVPVPYGVWDSGIWDTAIWGQDSNIQKQWQGVMGIGYCAAVRLLCQSSGINVSWLSTDLTMERGAIL